MFQAIVSGDAMISKTDIIPDLLPTMGFLKLRDVGHARTQR